MIWRAPIFEVPYWLDGPNNPAATPTVYEPDSPTVETGLLDAQGNKIIKVTRRPIGFLSR